MEVKPTALYEAVVIWQIASGLGVGAFIAALFLSVIKRFGHGGFQTSKLGKEATGIIAVLIILIFGGITVLALVLYAPHSGASSAATLPIPPKGRAVDPPSISPVSAARSWLTFIDDGDYDGSWDHSSVRLQESVDKFNWRKWFTEVRHPLGAPKDRTVIIVKPWKKIDEHTYWSQVDFKTHFQTDTQPERVEYIELSAIDGASPSVSAYALSEKRDASGNMIVVPRP
jgi:hypothetical protein